MKAKLNKNFDQLVLLVDYLWNMRKKIIADKLSFEYPKYLGFKNDFSADLVDSIDFVIEFHLWEGKIKNKKRLLEAILEYAAHDFYREFVKGIEE